MPGKSNARRLNAPVTNFNPVAGTIIGMQGGRGKREMGRLMAFLAMLCTQIVVKSPHCGTRMAAAPNGDS
jgi:hypothetical protein